VGVVDEPGVGGPGDGGPEVLSDAALRRAVEAAPDGVVVIDETGRIVFANPTLEALFGYPRGALLGEAVEMLLPESLREAHLVHRKEYGAHPRTRPMGSGLDLRGRRRDGREFPVEIGLSPLPGSTPPQVLAIVRDVTSRREAQDALARAQEALALVEDRERIARDLHDTVIQRLFAVGLSLQGVIVRTDSPEIAQRVEVAIDEIDTTIRDIRTAIFALNTRHGLAGGPRDDVLAVARESARSLGFEPRVTFDGLVDAAMPDAVHHQLVPTLREILSNVAKHARARHVHVLLAVDADVVLEVTDDGVGVPSEPDTGEGLRNIRERAALLGGGCLVGARPEGGTRVEWRVPLHPRAV
jgi:PAS domain S-box-containing protein